MLWSQIMTYSNSRFLRWSAPLALIFCCLGYGTSSQAKVICQSEQACTQTIELTPGWNAIYVQVAADEEATEQVFADHVDEEGPQISSVWTWLPHRAKIDFIQDPDPDNLLSAPGWLRFFPEQAPEAFMTNLFAIQPNRAYLVNLAGDAAVTLTINGKPVVPKTDWESDSFNLVGFHVDPDNLPTFADFFDSSPAHKNQPIYRLLNDSWEKVNPLNAIIQPDVAYWIFSKVGSDFTGPLHVELPQLNRLDYSTTLDSLTPRLKNTLTSAQSVSINIIGDAQGMFYPNTDLSAAQKWLPLSASLQQTIPADGELRFPLGVRRADFTPADFKQTLEIIGAAGSRWLIPVSAIAPKLNSLWIGSVTIDQVSQVQNYKHDCSFEAYDVITSEVVDGEPIETTITVPAQTFALCVDEEGLPITKDAGNVLTPVADEFSFRFIMHRDGSLVRLLKDVIQMRKVNADGTVGDYVLLTDDTLISEYSGVVLRDGEAVGRRVSTMAYDFGHTPDEMGENEKGEEVVIKEGAEITSMDMDAGGSLDSQVTFQLEMPAEAATNPFRHHYHKQHGKRAYTVIRKMEFTFETAENELGAGYDYKVGTYREVVDGLHRLPIVAAGTFTLRHAAQINKLNQ
jgi:hypothetical protein